MARAPDPAELVDPRHSGRFTFYDVRCEVAPAVPVVEGPLQLRRILGSGDSMDHATGSDLTSWCATVEPDALGLFFADGLYALGWAMDEERATAAHLRPALDPAVALGTAGHWLLALALGARGPRAVELGVDVAVDGLAQRRVDEAELGAILGTILGSGMGKGARYAASLVVLGQASAAHAAAVARTLQHALHGDPGRAPRDIGRLLLLLHELLVATGGHLDHEPARAWLSAMTRGGQVARAKKALLGG